MTDLVPEFDEWVTDKDIARRWGVGIKTARVAIRGMERNPAFPKRDPLFGGRRYWPAVVTFMRNRAGLTIPTVPNNGDCGIVENFDDAEA